MAPSTAEMENLSRPSTLMAKAEQEMREMRIVAFSSVESVEEWPSFESLGTESGIFRPVRLWMCFASSARKDICVVLAELSRCCMVS